MTLAVLKSVDVEETRPLFPAVSEASPAVAQFEAIIRAWKGETVGQATAPQSPVGEADLDGSLTLEKPDSVKAMIWLTSMIPTCDASCPPCDRQHQTTRYCF